MVGQLFPILSQLDVIWLWPAGHFSTVTMELKQNISSAELSLSQTEVPEAECARTKAGWQRYIFQRIKNTFGYGSQLF